MKYKPKKSGIVTAVQFFKKSPPKEATMVWSHPTEEHFVRAKKHMNKGVKYIEEYVVENSYSDNQFLADTNWIVTNEDGCARIMEDWEFQRVYRLMGTVDEERLMELLNEPT